MNKQDFDEKYRGTFVQDESLLQLACVRHEFLKEFGNEPAILMTDERYRKYMQHRQAIDKVLHGILLKDEAKDFGRIYHRLRQNMSEEDIARKAAQCVARPAILKRVSELLAPKGREL